MARQLVSVKEVRDLVVGVSLVDEPADDGLLTSRSIDALLCSLLLARPLLEVDEEPFRQIDYGKPPARRE
jgi:hypothetical protein